MAEQVKSIKSSGGTYVNISTWEAAIPADQALADPWIANVEESYDCNSAGTIVNPSNANNAPHRITVSDASTYRHYQHASWPTVQSVDANVARSSGRVRMDTNNIICEFLTFSAGASWMRKSDCEFRYCLWAGATGDVQIGNSGTANDMLFHNNIILRESGTAACIITYTGTVDLKVYHNTILGDSTQIAFWGFGGTSAVANGNVNFTKSSGGGFNGLLNGADELYNVTDQSTGLPDSSNLLSQVDADWLTDPDPATGVPTLKIGKYGVQVTPGFTADIGSLDFEQKDRDTSASSWDAGAIGIARTPVTKLIKSTGGDYATITLYEAAISADPSFYDFWTGTVDEAYDADVATVTVNVSNIYGAPHLLTVTEAYRIYNAASWPTDMYAAIGEAAHISGVLNVTTESFITEFLGLASESSGSTTYNSDNGILRFVASRGSFNHTASVLTLIHTCIFITFATGAGSWTLGTDGSQMYQCSFIGNTDTANGIWRRFGGFCESRGCLAFNAAAGRVAVPNFGHDIDYHCQDGTQVGTNGLASQVDADWVENLDQTVGDVRIKSGKQGVLVTPGYTSIIGSLDFAQVDRDDEGSWDVGALGVVVVPAAVVSSIIWIT